MNAGDDGGVDGGGAVVDERPAVVGGGVAGHHQGGRAVVEAGLGLGLTLGSGHRQDGGENEKLKRLRLNE